MVMTRLPIPVKQSHDGFTLLELMVVLVIISIVSAVMVAEMSGNFQDALLRSSGRKLINVFNLASTRAISINRLHRVRIDRATGNYVIEKHVRGDQFAPADVGGGAGTVDSRIAVQIEDASDPSSVNQESRSDQGGPGNAINFYPDGTADAREVDLHDRDGFGLALRVNPVTARVQIIELGRE
jgi:type II secretion system protein H